MKKIIYIMGLLMVLFSTSCEDQYSDEPVELTTQEELTMTAFLPLENYIGTVLGFSSEPVNFSIVSANPEGAVSIDSRGNINVANASLFDINTTPTMTVDVAINSGGFQKTTTVTINLDFRDTDGDGVIDFDEVANNTDLNDPCDPIQDAGYDGFNLKNKIWAAADCDGDGALNGDDKEPYFACVDNIATSIWAGDVVVEDVGFASITTTATSSCRAITLIGDLIEFSFDVDCSEDTVVLLFEPEFEGATKGTVTIPDQLYLDVCVGFEDRIRSIDEGTYDEETGIILVDYVVYFDEFDPALIDTDYFGGTLSVKPE